MTEPAYGQVKFYQRPIADIMADFRRLSPTELDRVAWYHAPASTSGAIETTVFHNLALLDDMDPLLELLNLCGLPLHHLAKVGLNLLLFAIRVNSNKIAKFLLQSGLAKFDARYVCHDDKKSSSRTQQDALSNALDATNLEMVLHLLPSYSVADLMDCTRYGGNFCAALIPISRDDRDAVAAMVKRGVDYMQVRDAVGCPAISWAVYVYSYRVLFYLLMQAYPDFDVNEPVGPYGKRLLVEFADSLTDDHYRSRKHRRHAAHVLYWLLVRDADPLALCQTEFSTSSRAAVRLRPDVASTVLHILLKHRDWMTWASVVTVVRPGMLNLTQRQVFGDNFGQTSLKEWIKRTDDSKEMPQTLTEIERLLQRRNDEFE